MCLYARSRSTCIVSFNRFLKILLSKLIFQVFHDLWAAFTRYQPVRLSLGLGWAVPPSSKGMWQRWNSKVHKVVKLGKTGWGVWAMLPSAGQSRSALRVPAPAIYYRTPLIWRFGGCPATWAVQAAWDFLRWVLTSCHGTHFEQLSLCSWLIPILSLPSGFPSSHDPYDLLHGSVTRSLLAGSPCHCIRGK